MLSLNLKFISMKKWLKEYHELILIYSIHYLIILMSKPNLSSKCIHIIKGDRWEWAETRARIGGEDPPSKKGGGSIFGLDWHIFRGTFFTIGHFRPKIVPHYRPLPPPPIRALILRTTFVWKLKIENLTLDPIPSTWHPWTGNKSKISST